MRWLKVSHILVLIFDALIKRHEFYLIYKTKLTQFKKSQNKWYSYTDFSLLSIRLCKAVTDNRRKFTERNSTVENRGLRRLMFKEIF